MHNAPPTIDVLLAPGELPRLQAPGLASTVCVVFDILRATTSIVEALANGAKEVLPAGEIAEAVASKKRFPEMLLAGERDGLRIRAEQSGGIEFDFGNSPREFTAAKVQGQRIVMTTTNGTRALKACAGCAQVIVGSFLGLRAIAEWVTTAQPQGLMMVCAGTHEQAALEDVLAAGALCELISPAFPQDRMSDACEVARRLFLGHQENLLGAVLRSRNGRRLQSIPGLGEDIPVCMERDKVSFVAGVCPDGAIRILS